MLTATPPQDKWRSNLQWDDANRLTGVTYSGNTTSYVYDGDGNRVKRTMFGATTAYVGAYYEKNLSTGVVTKYYYLGGKRVAMRQGGTVSFLLGDHLGSTRVTADSSGNRVAELWYWPYGNTRLTWGSTPTDRKYTGQVFDSNAGLYYYGARYYDVQIGRFISADPIVPEPGNPQDLNRYSYVRNNPLRFADPSGYQPVFDPGFGGGRRPIPPGRYISTPDYGFFDTSHFGTGNPRTALQQARRVEPGRWRRKAWPAPLDTIAPVFDPKLWQPISFDDWGEFLGVRFPL